MHGHTDGLEERLAKMLAAGRITADEAERVRAAAERGEVDDTVAEIRLGHVKDRLDAAVANGELTAEEADAVLERVAAGERPRLPRGRRRVLRRRSPRHDAATHDSGHEGDSKRP
jgi:hypothetical protein